MCNLSSRPRNEPMPPTLKGGVPTTGSPGKSSGLVLGVERVYSVYITNIKDSKLTLPVKLFALLICIAILFFLFFSIVVKFTLHKIYHLNHF